MKEQPPLKLKIEITEDLTLKVILHNTSKKRIPFFPRDVQISFKKKWKLKFDPGFDVWSIESREAPPRGPLLSHMVTLEPGKTAPLGVVLPLFF